MSAEGLQDKPYGPDVFSGTHRRGPIDWHALQAAGVDFAIVKKDQGNFYDNPYYLGDTWDAVNAGLLVGFYHFLSYRSLPADQTAHYLANARTFMNGTYFQPIIDFENQGDTGEPLPLDAQGHPFTPSPLYMANWLHDMALQVHTETGLWPIIYTYPYFFNVVLADVQHTLAPIMDNCPLWVADYSHRNPQPVGEWAFPTFHQYTSTGHVDGISVPADLNRFNGDSAGLARMAGGK